MWAGRTVTTLVVLCWALTAHAAPAKTKTPTPTPTPTPTQIRTKTPTPINPFSQSCAGAAGQPCDCFWNPINPNAAQPTYAPPTDCFPICNGVQYKCRTVAVAAVAGGDCMVNGTNLMGNATVGMKDCINITCNVGACPCQTANGSSVCLNGGTCTAPNGTAVCSCSAGFTGNNCEISPFVTPPAVPATPPATPIVCNSTGGQPCECVKGPQNTTQCDPCTKKQYRCSAVITPAVNDGPCILNGTDYNDTAKIGDLDCTVLGCSAGTCQNNTVPPNDPCFPNGTAFCQNNGWCYLDPATNNGPACRCSGAFTGATCNQTATGNNSCSANPCQNGAPCFVATGGSDYICNCTAGFYGKNCDIQPCNNFCQNGAPCTPRYGAAFCDCSKAVTAPPANTIWAGAACNVSLTNDPCAGIQSNASCQNNGTLAGAYGECRCVCPTGFSGDDCSVKAPAKNTCQTANVVKCVSQVKTTGDSSTSAVKCTTFSAYATCAANSSCTDLLSLWCGVYFKQLPTCSIPACSAIPGNCNMTIYQQCWAASANMIVNGDFCSGSILASCAAAANCNNLLLSFCANLDSCPNRPADCNQFQRGTGSGQLVDLGMLPAWDVLMPSKYYEKPQSASHAMLIVAAVVGVMLVAAVGVAIRRRRQMRGPMEYALVESA